MGGRFVNFIVLQGSYKSLVFERTAYIEQQHVDNIAAKIRELGGTPTKFGDIMSPMLGYIAGELSSFTGIENTLKISLSWVGAWEPASPFIWLKTAK